MKCPSLAKPEQRYHSIAPCLAGKRSAEEQADALGISYSTVCRWLRQFREEGMPGLFPSTDYPREPQTPERELARVLNATTDHRIHHETVKALLQRYPIWRHPEFQRLIQYPAPDNPQLLRRSIQRSRLDPRQSTTGHTSRDV